MIRFLQTISSGLRDTLSVVSATGVLFGVIEQIYTSVSFPGVSGNGWCRHGRHYAH
jgi:hypothetical protein